MKWLRLLLIALSCWLTSLAAQPGAAATTPSTNASGTATNPTTGAGAPPASANAASNDAQQKQLNTTAAAADYEARHPPAGSHLLEGLVDRILAHFDLDPTRNTPTRYGIAVGCIVVALILRGIVIGIVFGLAERFSARTKTTLDDRLFPALQRPVSVLITVLGIAVALRILKLSPEAEYVIDYSTTVAISLVIFWLLYRGFATVLDHAEDVARGKQLGIAAFSPWIKKTLITFFVIVGVLILLQSLGYNVKAFLAGLGIGGLAFALAAQDTLANLFGSVVIAIDQPFKIGEAVQIGANGGSVEDIGLRSTRLRKPDKSLLIIPNKTVAGEVIVNQSRFTQRRVEQTIGVTYDSPVDEVAGLVSDIRALITAEDEVEKPSIFVQFLDFGPSSLLISIAYQTLSPDYFKQCALKQRLNISIMRAVAARKLSFAFPTQTVFLDGPVPRAFAENNNEKSE